MESYTTCSFWDLLSALPEEVKGRAKKQYLLWLDDPGHPSLQFKKVGGNLWSARVTEAYRALALKKGEDFHWFWIGTHREYEKIIH
jgi:hypothetical protein